jgi:hypothetical protein
MADKGTPKTGAAATFRRSKRRTDSKPYHMKFDGAPNDTQVATICNYLRKWGVSVTDDPKIVKIPRGTGLHVQGQADALKKVGYTIVRVG